MPKSLLRTNSRRDLELERYFGKIKATCARKVIVTTFDLLYLLAVNLPIFVIFAYYNPNEGFIDAFHQLVERSQKIEAWRMFAFSLWMCFVLYIYFVLIPSKTQYQTFLSSFLGMKAVTLDDNLNWKGKLSQAKLFRANLVPVFSIPIMSAIFFYCAWITNNQNWYEQIIKDGFRTIEKNPSLPVSHYWVYGMRMVVVVVFFLQLHHLFTVGASPRALNWFTKSNGIIYVNVERALLVMASEDRPTPNKFNPDDVTLPLSHEIKEDSEPEEEAEEDEEGGAKKKAIDFSEDIEMDTEEFLQRLREREQEQEQESQDGGR